MRIITGHHKLKSIENLLVNGCVATIGNFDGIHLGHKHILHRATCSSKKLNIPSVAIIFEPQPAEFFLKDNYTKLQPRLLSLKEKLLILKEININIILILPFNKILAKMSAKQFVADILVSGLHVMHLIIGRDFKFGYKRTGDVTYLKNMEEQYNFIVETAHTLLYDKHRISSGWLRKVLQASDFALSKQLLGRNYTITGRIVHGDRRGHLLGFPTANIRLNRKKSPILGVFVVQIAGIDKNILCGVANIGKRPTIDNKREILLEVHILDFDKEIYGHILQVSFLHKLRDEEHYTTLHALVEQMKLDVINAKKFLKEKNHEQ